MSETFRCDDKEMFVAYLYGEIDIDGRREVERHIRTCGACAHEAEVLQGVREDLASWQPPEPDLGFVIVQKPATVLRPGRWARLGSMPAWAQAAAAVLVLGLGASIANVQVRYDNEGLTVRTGWMAPTESGSSAAAPGGVQNVSSRYESWRPALTALEDRLRRDLAPPSAAQSAEPLAVRASETNIDAAALMRRVEALVNASEQRQRDEIGLRLTQAQRDWSMQRRADMDRIDQRVGSLQGRTLMNAAGQQEMMDLLRRVSARPIP
jgi:anti-sigma factor RsiW